MSNNRPKYHIIYAGCSPVIIEELKSRDDLIGFEVFENVITTINRLKELKNIFVRPDAILCDVNFQGLSGFDFYKKVIADSFFYNIPFILYDSMKNQPNKQLARELKVDDLYSGNFKVEKFHTRVFYLNKYLNYKPKPANFEEIPFKVKIPFSKRFFDFSSSLMAIILLSPLLLFVAVMIKIGSKGPIIYKSKRVGSGYNVFYFYKFRSMRTKADTKVKELESKNVYKADDKLEICTDCTKTGGYCSPLLYIHGETICENLYLKRKKAKIESTFKKFADDPRVTRIGKFIRKTSIDELPQLFNVLKGDMSIVGNRPLPLYEAEMLTSDQWSERFLGPAGITGMWQVML